MDIFSKITKNNPSGKNTKERHKKVTFNTSEDFLSVINQKESQPPKIDPY